MTRARNHSEAGRGLYNTGNYKDAVREFAAGYELVHKPAFLLNLGQAYRKMNDLVKAREMYQKYLSEATPRESGRRQVQQIIDDIDRTLRENPPPPQASPSPAPVAHPEPSPSPSSEAESSPALQLTNSAPPPQEKQTFLRKNWWIIPVAGVVVAAAVVGIYLAARPPNQVDCSAATLGCIDTTKP